MAPNTSRTWNRTVFTFANMAPAPKSSGELGAPFTFAHTVGHWAGGTSNSSQGRGDHSKKSKINLVEGT